MTYFLLWQIKIYLFFYECRKKRGKEKEDFVHQDGPTQPLHYHTSYIGSVTPSLTNPLNDYQTPPAFTLDGYSKDWVSEWMQKAERQRARQQHPEDLPVPAKALLYAITACKTHRQWGIVVYSKNKTQLLSLLTQ